VSRQISFDLWKELLRNDCDRLRKMEAFQSLGDAVLRVLWESCVDPSVDAVVREGLPGSK
jgi:hypothetical protein